MNKHFIDLKIETKDSLSTIKDLYRHNIEIEHITYLNNNIIVKVSYNDYLEISKYYKTKILKHYNLYGLKNDIKKDKFYILSIILLFIFIYIISNIIIDIKIVTSNYEMNNLITYELNKHEVKKYTLKKDYYKLLEIKEQILNDNKDTIEWLEIENIGMSYVVKVENRIINNIEKETSYCNLVAKKDGLIKRFNISKGELLVNINDYVKQGDILVTGSINYNEENKNNVCAEGVIYANTWYNMNIKINTSYKEKNITKNKRYNLSIKNKDIDYRLFKDRLDNYETTKKRILKLFNTEIFLDTDYELESITKEYKEEDIENLIDKEIKNKFSNLLKDEYKIVSKNVLKKEIKDSIIDIDIFVVVEENIAKKEEYQIME